MQSITVIAAHVLIALSGEMHPQWHLCLSYNEKR